MSRKNHVDKIRATPGSTTKPSLAAKWATRPAFVNAPTSDVLRIAARERQYLGQDLHDQCGQELTALGILADALVVRLRAKLLPEVQLAKKIQALGRVLLHRVRKIARASVMPMSGADLPHALRAMASSLSAAGNVRCSFTMRAAPTIPEGVYAHHLYRIAQEACTNSLRHGQARTIKIKLLRSAAGLTLAITDDGIGRPTDFTEGLGLRIMRARAASTGARLTITQSKPQGVVVTCFLPRGGPRAEKN